MAENWKVCMSSSAFLGHAWTLVRAVVQFGTLFLHPFLWMVTVTQPLKGGSNSSEGEAWHRREGDQPSFHFRQEKTSTVVKSVLFKSSSETLYWFQLAGPTRRDRGWGRGASPAAVVQWKQEGRLLVNVMLCSQQNKRALWGQKEVMGFGVYSTVFKLSCPCFLWLLPCFQAEELSFLWLWFTSVHGLRFLFLFCYTFQYFPFMLYCYQIPLQ